MTCKYSITRLEKKLTSVTKQDLIEFEKEIIKIYEQGKIKSPVHLVGGNENELIEIFKEVKDNDWVFSNHRAHYHSLLKSKDPKWLKKEIIENRSLHLNSKKYKIFTSAIVGGAIPIALGTAMGIKRQNKKDHIWCFIGDMAAEMGCFNEAYKYAKGHKLPITFIVEDNNLAVYTPTHKVWGITSKFDNLENVIKYDYERIYPHHGIGKFINF